VETIIAAWTRSKPHVDYQRECLLRPDGGCVSGPRGPAAPPWCCPQPLAPWLAGSPPAARRPALSATLALIQQL
jgi:hypothetical protein